MSDKQVIALIKPDGSKWFFIYHQQYASRLLRRCYQYMTDQDTDFSVDDLMSVAWRVVRDHDASEQTQRESF